MKQTRNRTPEIKISSHTIAKRLIEHAKAWASENYEQCRFTVEPVLIIERPEEPSKPFYWTIDQAGPSDGDPIQQTIPENTKDKFASAGRLLCIALKTEAVVFVTEAWMVIPKRRKGESAEELKARAEAETRDGLSQHPDRVERLVAIVEWIENQQIHHHHIFWEINRKGGKGSVGAMVSSETDLGKATGRMAHWICPAQPIPDEIATVAKTLLQYCGIAITSPNRRPSRQG